jgi:hypothetical protein
MRQKTRKILCSAVAAAVLAGALAGCSTSAGSTVITGASSASTAAAGEEADTSAQAAALSAVTGDYSDRDLDGTWDAAAATAIVCSGDTAAVTGTGATASAGLITISEAGTYVLSGSFTGQVLVTADSEDKVQIVLDGVTITSTDGPAINVQQADKVFLTLADGTQNAVSDSENYTLDADSDEPNACIYAKDDLTINGSGSLTVTGVYNHGIYCKDDLKVCGGTLTITAANAGLKGKDSVSVCAGTISITSGGDAIKSNNDSDTTLGWVAIDGGDITLSAGDDGIDAETAVTVNGGTLTVTDCVEGLEAAAVTINGGTVDVTSSDDGINASSGSAGTEGAMPDTSSASSDCTLTINGGTVTVTAGGDGLDSNGSLLVTGGVVLVSQGPNGGNGALDYNSTGTITGGIVIAAGSSDMAQNFSSDSTQGAILTDTGSQSAGTAIALTDASGNVIACFTPDIAYTSVVFSAPSLSTGP